FVRKKQQLSSIGITKEMSDNPVLDDRQKQERYEALVNELYQDVYRYAYWLCKNSALAEDLVQETFLRAWRSLDSLQNDKAAKAWLFTILRRENARLYERYRPDLVDIEDQSIADSDDNEPDQRLDRRMLHEAARCSSETRQGVARAISAGGNRWIQWQGNRRDTDPEQQDGDEAAVQGTQEIETYIHSGRSAGRRIR